MKYVVANLEEELLVLLSLMGVIENRRAYMPFSEEETTYEYYKKIRNQLVKNGYVSNRLKEYLKLRTKGVKRLREIGPELQVHAKICEYPTGERYKIKASVQSKIVKFVHDEDGSIDLIKLERKSNDFGEMPEEERIPKGKSIIEDGEICTVEEIFRGLDSDLNYFTSNLIKRIDFYFDAKHGNATKSSMVGILAKNGYTYPVFFPAFPEQRIYQLAEEKMLDRMLDYHEWINGRGTRYEKERREGIIFYDDRTNPAKLMKEKTGLNPSKFLKDIYIIPIEEAALPVLLITTPNFREEVNKIIYGSNVNETGESDGKIGGMSSYEFLTCNYAKIKKIKEQKEKVYVVCYEWQRESLEELLGNKVEYYEVPKEILEKMQGYISRKKI